MSSPSLGLIIGIPAAIGVLAVGGWWFSSELRTSAHAFEYRAEPTISQETYENIRNGNYVATEAWHSADRPPHRPTEPQPAQPSRRKPSMYEEEVDVDYGGKRQRKRRRTQRKSKRKASTRTRK